MSSVASTWGHETRGHRSSPTTVRSATTDRDEAERIITDLYLPNRLDLGRGSAPLHMEVTGVRVGALTASRLTYGRRVVLRTADAENFHVNVPVRGRATSRSGSSEPVTTTRGQALVFSPGAPAEMSWTADCEQLCLMIPRGRLEAELEQLLGRAPRGRLAFDFTVDPVTATGRRLRTVLDLLVDELDDPTQLLSDPRLGAHVEGLVAAGLLLGHPHSHREAVLGDRQVRLGAAIRRAVELLEDRPAEPWTTVRLATEVHLSVRALQEGFRRDLDTTPMTYLRQVRLRRAREALLAADRDTATVGAVAAGLGILHLGRFASTYREAFGEAPSETLNRPV